MQHVAQARVQIREVVGEIYLVPTVDGHLEAGAYGKVLASFTASRQSLLTASASQRSHINWQ